MEAEHPATWIAFGQFKVADMLERGDGVAPDLQAARAVYEALASSEISELALKADAHIRVAQMYLDGRGVPRSIENAYVHCESAAKLKSYSGYLCMGVLQESGQMGQPDYKKAAVFYERAVSLGDHRSMARLGRLYENGLGVKRDDVAALTLYLVSEGRLKPLPPRQSEALMAKMKPGDVRKASKKAAEWYPGTTLP